MRLPIVINIKVLRSPGFDFIVKTMVLASRSGYSQVSWPKIVFKRPAHSPRIVRVWWFFFPRIVESMAVCIKVRLDCQQLPLVTIP